MAISEEGIREDVLEEKVKRLKDLLIMVSHELRHPLTLVQGYASFLLESGSSLDAVDYDQALKGIQEGVGRLTGLAESLLNVALVECGTFRARRRPADLRLLIEEAAEGLRSRERREIVLDLRGELERVYLDWEMIFRLLTILLENACKFSPSDTDIEVRGEGRDGKVRISVLDRGIGISVEDRERIFDLFTKVGEAVPRCKPNLCVGLYMARMIVEAHKGRIWYREREGGGSEFAFEFPALPQESEDPPSW